LVELALAEVLHRLGAVVARSQPLRVVDVGTGSGTVAVALAVALRGDRALDAVDILATDASADALDLARENAVGHAVADRIGFAEADLLPADAPGAPSRMPFDVVVANLPYVRHDAIAGLPRATSFEPVIALDGGVDGLAVIDRLVERLPSVLTDDGVALLEIGADQGDSIVRLVGERLPGWRCAVATDLAGLPRVARIERPPVP
jgi:release factor glutamine methyltransferase